MNIVKNNSRLKTLLKKLRAKSTVAPSFDEITKEVETVRSKRYKNNLLLPRV